MTIRMEVSHTVVNPSCHRPATTPGHRCGPAPIIGIHRPVVEYVLRVALVGVLCLGFLGTGDPSAYAEVRSTDRLDGYAASELGVPAAAMPDVTMAAGALVTQDGRILWSRRVSDRRAMASITKIMTAVVALEHSKPTDLVTIPDDSVSVGESTAFLRAGEKLPMHEVLEGLMVKSGNDAAVAIAEHVADNEDEFVKLMNAKAVELGLKRTHFTNPHGLDEQGHYSSAADLAILARYAMTKPEFRAIVGEKTAEIGSGARSETLHSTNLLLGNYQGANGIKTGWTNKAGYCVIDSANRDGVELYAVVLGTTGELKRFRDARELLDFGFAHYRPQRLVSAGTVIGQAPVTEYLDVTVPAAVSENTTVTVFDLQGPITRTVTMSEVEAPVKTGQRVGVVTFTQRGQVIASVPLVATHDVPDPTLVQRVGIAVVRAWRRLTGASS